MYRIMIAKLQSAMLPLETLRLVSEVHGVPKGCLNFDTTILSHD
jgi:hypothetical protein